MSFLDAIQDQLKSAGISGGNSKGGNQENTFPKTKHNTVQMNKNTPSVMVMVLPSKNHTFEGAFKAVRKIMFQYPKTENEKKWTNLTLDPMFNPDSNVENRIVEWQEKEMMPSKYGQQRPGVVFLTNVTVLHKNDQGQYMPEKDNEGKLVVRVMEMKATAVTALQRLLEDSDNNTAQDLENSELSFLHPQRPKPVKITKPSPGEQSYHVEVKLHLNLPPLPQGWEDQLEDLEAFGQPTEVHSKGFVDYIISRMDGTPPPNQQQSQSSNSSEAPQADSNPYAGEAQNPPEVGKDGQVKEQPYTPPAQKQEAPTPKEEYQAPPVEKPSESEEDLEAKLRAELGL